MERTAQEIAAENDRLYEIEWMAWRLLCERLRAAGAVTEHDLLSSLDPRATPGQALLQAIREWGDHRAALPELP